jgi:hypothetical protein
MAQPTSRHIFWAESPYCTAREIEIVFEYFLFGLAAAFPVLAIFAAITFLTPTWHWPVGFMLIIASLLTALWAQHWYVASLPGYKEGPGGALGIIIVSIWTAGFAIASLAYIAGLIWWHALRPRGRQTNRVT